MRSFRYREPRRYDHQIWRQVRFRWLLAGTAAILVIATACGGSSGSAKQSIASPTSDEATRAYVALIRAYWGDLHVADVATDGSDVDAKACLGEMSSTSQSDVQEVEPQTCRAYAVATAAADEKFIAKLDTVRAPARFVIDDQLFRTQIPKAIPDLNRLVAACDGPNRQAIIDSMLAYARDMIPDVTNALDDVDSSVTHLDPSQTG